MAVQRPSAPHLPVDVSQVGDSSALGRLAESSSDTLMEKQLESSLASDPEKQAASRSPSGNGEYGDVTAQDPIVYCYLEFETELPQPAPSSTKAECGGMPKAPDLKKYGSPFEWSYTRKALTIWISTVSTALTAYTAGSYASGVDQMAADWHISRVAVLVGITTFTCGFGIGPMFLAPFSELNGRRPVFVVTGITFVICQACCAITPSYYGMLLARFFTGVSSSTFSTMVSGVISDIYRAEHRNTPMAIYTGGVFFGTGMGPLISGFIAQNTTWRWIFYLQIITCGVVMGLMVVFFPESRGNVLLSRRAKELNMWYEAGERAGCYGYVMPGENVDKMRKAERIRWKVKSDEERESLRQMLTVSLSLPFHLLFTEPVVFFFSVWISFSWTVLYLTFDAVPLLFETTYHFSLQGTGAVFASISAAAVLFTPIAIYQDKLARRMSNLFTGAPEDRLYFACVESILLPVGLFWLGWTVFPSVPWIVPALAIACATIGIFSIYLCVFNYLADTYHGYASSAIAAQSLCRNWLGGAFPLYTDQMFNRMGFHAAASLLGGFGLVLTLVPWVLAIYGTRIRARSKFATKIMK